MTPDKIRTRSGRKTRARLHASWSPAARHHARRTLIRVLGVGGALLLLLVIGVNVYAVSFLDSLPRVDDLDSSQFDGDTIIVDRGGKQLADLGQHGDRRLNVTLDQVSPKVVQATVAVEDKNFWTNPGFDTEAILRTVASNFRAGGITGGASTITQQLAKQQFLTPEQTVDRKLKELVLAYRLAQTYPKQKILELYLNKSYYGEQQYGVQAASLTYFKKNAKDLDLAQAALIAGLVRAPDAYDPVQHLDNAKRRQKEVLDAMVRSGYITIQEENAAFAEHLDISRPINSNLAPHFVAYVGRELQRLGFKPGQQLRVVTTLDYNKQAAAEQDVRDNLKANLYHDRDGELNSALVSMDPKTGQIMAYVGSPDINGPAGQYDLVDQVLVNPGSSVKLFTYAKAIADGKLTMDTPILDGPNPLVIKLPGAQKPYEVRNFDKKLHGIPPARVALASSLNIPAVKVEMAEGVPAVVDWYRNLGMRPRENGSADSPNTAFGPSLTLGGYPITMLEEVTALSTFANLGVYHQPEAILQVTNAKGATVYQADPNRGARQAIPPGVAFIIASILSDDANRAPIFGANTPLHLSERHAAAKTGTNEDFRSAVTVGFTPDLATVVWIGDTGGKDTKDNIHTLTGTNTDAVYVAAPLWHKFMVQALAGVPDNWYTPPGDVTKGPGNSWYLKTATKVDHLPGDNPRPSPTPVDYGVPGDPGGGPKPVGTTCKFFPICPPSPGPGG